MPRSIALRRPRLAPRGLRHRRAASESARRGQARPAPDRHGLSVPGPWIVADPDSKAESALKVLPLGTFLQGMQEDRINELSKDIQPYLPRPRYDQAVEAALINALKGRARRHGADRRRGRHRPLQRRDWNAASDQLDWRPQVLLHGRGPGLAARLLEAALARRRHHRRREPLLRPRARRSGPHLAAAVRRLARVPAPTPRACCGAARSASATRPPRPRSPNSAPRPWSSRTASTSCPRPLAGKIAAGLARDIGLIAAPPPILAETAPAAPPLNASPPEISTAPPPGRPAAPTNRPSPDKLPSH